PGASSCDHTVPRNQFILFHPLLHFFFHSLRPLLRNYFTLSIIREKRLLLLFIRLHFLKFITLPLFPLLNCNNKCNDVLYSSFYMIKLLSCVDFCLCCSLREEGAGPPLLTKS